MSERLQFIGISLLSIAGGIVAIYFSGFRERWHLRERGIEANAGIIKLRTDFWELNTSSEAGAAHDIARIWFSDRQGNRHTIEVDLPARIFKRIKQEGLASVEVIYDPLNPSRCMVKGEPPGSALAVLFGVGLMLFGGYSLWTHVTERDPAENKP